MNFTLGIFDLFACAVPGSLYLALFVYVAQVSDWIDVTQAGNISSVLLIVVIAIVSFLLGHITYPLVEMIERVFRLQRLRALDAKRDFVAKCPASANRSFLHADPFVLLAAAELHDKEVAAEISRLRATGLMLRNSSLALVFAAITAFFQLTLGGYRRPAIICVIMFLLATVGSYWHGETLSHWANTKTLEICSLLPGIDDKLKPPTDEASA
jgi:hypothetical protein